MKELIIFVGIESFIYGAMFGHVITILWPAFKAIRNMKRASNEE